MKKSNPLGDDFVVNSGSEADKSGRERTTNKSNPVALGSADHMTQLLMPLVKGGGGDNAASGLKTLIYKILAVVLIAGVISTVTYSIAVAIEMLFKSFL